MGRVLILLLFLAGTGWAEYVSPYRVEFTQPGVTEGFNEDVRQEAAAPTFERWYDLEAYTPGQRPWGPRPARFPAPTPPAGADSLQWRRERAVATAVRYLGYAYQHHHIPDWCPTDPTWPWKPVAAGKQTKGLDCSNFTGWIYNYGLGMLMNTDVRRQAEEGRALLAGVTDYDRLVAELQTGDLLYIRNRKGEISHVIMWLGSVGRSPDGVPLVIDSHGADTKDSNGVLIPAGIHLRPFRAGSWYHRSFAHAHRLVF